MCAIGSAFGPIIVMIDASRLGHSLATALKDRPHGIPVQPNRSLPLRPPPPIPVRIPLTKSPKNAPVTQAAATATQETLHNGESLSNGITDSNAKHRNSINDEAPNPGVVGMNFYDSKEKERGDNLSDITGENLSQIPKDLGNSRHSKSLDNDKPDEGKREDKRRKSLDYETDYCEDNSKRRNTSNIELPKSSEKFIPKDKEGRSSFTSKRKSFSPDVNPDLSKKEKTSKVENSEAISENEAKDDVSGSNNSDGVESSGTGFPTIWKFRTPKSNFSPLTEKNARTSSSPYKYILPKPANDIPKCPVTIPIEIARVMNRRDKRIWNIHSDITKSQIGNMPVTTSRYYSTEPKIDIMETSEGHVSGSIEDVENTLPSMPSLEDIMQADGLKSELMLHSGQVDGDKVRINVASELTPMAQAGVLQLPADMTSQTDNSYACNSIQANTQSTLNDHNSNQPHDSVVNFTTVLKIQIPVDSPDLIFLPIPQIMPDSKIDDVAIANESPVEATTPISLSSGIESGLVEPGNIVESNKSGPLSELRENHQECHTSQGKSLSEKNPADIIDSMLLSLINGRHQQQSKDLFGKDEPQYTLQHKSPVDYEVRIKDTSDLCQTPESVEKFNDDESMDERQQDTIKNAQTNIKLEDIKRCRKNRHNLKLKKLIKEEATLIVRMGQTSDPSRLTRLQQKLNCARKRIENTRKYLSRLVIVENPEPQANTAPMRIQVRRDLVRKMSSPESPNTSSQSPLHSINGTDEASTTSSQPNSPPVITLSETDTASSDEETEAIGGQSPDHIRPYLQLRVEMKLNDKNIPEYDMKVVSSSGNPSPDYEADKSPLDMSLETTNNNVEYLNKNLPPVYEDVCTTVNTPSMIIPLVPASTNTEARSIPQVAMSSNTESPSMPLSMPLVPASSNTGPNNFSRVTPSANIDATSISRGPASTNSNTDSISIPQGPPSASTGSMSIPKLPASANSDWISMPPLIRDPSNFTPSNLNGIASQRSPSIQYGVPNVNLPPDKVDKELSKSRCDCQLCLRDNSTAAIKKTAKLNENNLTPGVVRDLRTPRTIRRTAIDENKNVHPVPNHPAHRTDYSSTSGNVPSMFSRDNGGANINLSSPLQGHSALPLPPPYWNSTAQGYPMPAEPGLNHQTTQWHNNQHPPMKSLKQFTPNQDAQPHPCVLAPNLLETRAQESASYAGSMKPPSLAQNKDAIWSEPGKHMGKQTMTAQFPTLGNWAAQMTRDSSIGEFLNGSIADQAAYKTTGSNMSKMATAVVNHAHLTKTGNASHWQSPRPSPEQLRPTQGFPSQRNIPHPYRSDYQQHPQIPQNVPNGPPGYPGSQTFVSEPPNSYRQIPSAAQNVRSADYPGSQSSRLRQNVQQYQPSSSSTRQPVVPGPHQNQVSSTHLANTVGMIPQQYFQPPQSYVQAVYPQWQTTDDYRKNYVSSQYNGFNVQSKMMDNNSTVYRQRSENMSLQMQPQVQAQPDNIMKNHLIRDISNVKLPMPIHDMSGNLNAIIQDGRNGEALDLGNSYRAPYPGKARKGSAKPNNSFCSMCGNFGAKFNCLGCKNAFYCNEHCQTQHWIVHFLECSKKMPKLKKIS